MDKDWLILQSFCIHVKYLMPCVLLGLLQLWIILLMAQYLQKTCSDIYWNHKIYKHDRIHKGQLYELPIVSTLFQQNWMHSGSFSTTSWKGPTWSIVGERLSSLETAIASSPFRREIPWGRRLRSCKELTRFDVFFFWLGFLHNCIIWISCIYIYIHCIYMFYIVLLWDVDVYLC